MRREQRVVTMGAATGLLAMLTAMLVLPGYMPTLEADADAGERLAFGFRWNALAVLPLFLAIASVGNARFKSEAIDPTAGKESRRMLVDGRVVDNTVQQYLLFLAASSAVASSARGDELGLVAAAALIFVVARLAFWIGYRIDPLYRALGMAATLYLTVVLFGVALWMAWRD